MNSSLNFIALALLCWLAVETLPVVLIAPAIWALSCLPMDGWNSDR